MSADNTDQTLPDAKTEKAKGKDDNTSILAEMQEQLRAMNDRMEATQTAIAEANKRAAPPQKQEEENLYDPTVVLARAEKIFDTRLREEKQKDITIFQLADEFPEIKSDPKVRQSVMEAQKGLPSHLQDTAQGYELAVLQATSKHGLIKRSQRKVVEDEPSYDGTRRSNRSEKKAKVSQATLDAAALMGVNVEDPDTVKRLEGYTNRDTYSKYR